MRFFHRPVHDFPDVSLNFEQLEARTILDRKLTIGTATVTWPGGSRISSVTTQAHGLGVTPTAVLLTPVSTGNTVVMENAAPDATSITIVGNTMDGSSPAAATSRTLYWLAIG